MAELTKQSQLAYDKATKQAEMEEGNVATATVVIRSVVILLAIASVYNQVQRDEIQFFQSAVLSVALQLACPGPLALFSVFLPVVLAGHCVSVGLTPNLLQCLLFLPQSLFLIGIPMSAILHRYFAHGAYETSRPMQFVLGLLACLAYQGGPLWWAGKHRRHHRHCDLPNDPHSWKQTNYFHAFLGWTFISRAHSSQDHDYLPKNMLVSELKVLDWCYLVPCITVAYLVHAQLGYAAMVWTTLLPMTFSRLITLLFNVEYHPQDGEKLCKGADIYRILGVIVGESLHGEHHMYPRQAHRADLDLPWWVFLNFLHKAGLIWNIH